MTTRYCVTCYIQWDYDEHDEHVEHIEMLVHEEEEFYQQLKLPEWSLDDNCFYCMHGWIELPPNYMGM